MTAQTTNASYDWVWRRKARKNNQPMTFSLLLHEAIEICSPELFCRRVFAFCLISEAYTHGLGHRYDLDFSYRNRGFQLARRIVDQLFVRAYLFERRAGVPPRVPGPPPEADACLYQARELMRGIASLESERHERERARKRELEIANRGRAFAAVWAAIGCLAAEDRS